MKMLRLAVVSLGAAALFSAGCSTYKDQRVGMTKAWHSGQADVAAQQFSKVADKASKSDSIVWHLEAAAAYRAANDYTNSNRHLEAAANVIDEYEQKAKVKVGHEAAAVMSNQQNLPYEGKPYDKIMLHTYRALNYLALGDTDKARPELIRAYQRQQDAVDENARRIEKAREEEAKAKDKEKAAMEKARADKKFNATLDGISTNLNEFKFYADYVNPFTVYLDGLYFLHAGSGASDLERANKSFQRILEVCGSNKFIEADFACATNAMAGKEPGPCTYVIFETGEGASFDQVRVDIPIIVTKVSYVGAAFPKLALHNDYIRTLTVKAGDVQETTLPIANIDSIVALDFKNELPTIVTKTLISTVAKAVAAYAANEAASQQSGLAGLIMQVGTAVVQASLNIADTRCWSTLPKEIQIARVPTPADRKLTLSCGAFAPTEVTLIDGKVNVVYAKSITSTTPLLTAQFKLK